MTVKVKFYEPKRVFPNVSAGYSEVIIHDVESVKEFYDECAVTISTTFYGVLELTDVEEIRFIF